MSQENVDIVRGIYATWERRDHAAAFAAYAPDIEWDMTRSGYPGTTTGRGHDAVRTAMRDGLAAFRELKFEPIGFVDAGDYVLVTVHDRGVGRGSGVVVDRYHYAVWKLARGKVVVMRVYLDPDEALRAVGLAGRASFAPPAADRP